MQAEIERAFAPRFETGTEEPAAEPAAAPAPAPPPPRPAAAPQPTARYDRRQNDRRQGDRRGMDALRAEALQAVISRVEDRNFNGLKNRIQWPRRLPLSRVLLLLVALGAGGIAAYLALQNSAPAPAPVAEQVTQIVQEPRARILVAKDTIAVGQRLSPETVEWAEWPEGAVRTDYITVAATPDAITDMTGAVARFEIFPGEPIRLQKLSQEAGYLSAILDSGLRGVSVSVAAEAASGGLIIPNDHVDVVLTRTITSGQVSETILRNVSVLAINSRLGETAPTEAADESAEATPQGFADVAIATLALDPMQAEVIINATGLGRLSLVLVPTADIATPASAEEPMTDTAANQAIRISSPFWTR